MNTCRICPAPAVAVVSDRYVCERCGIDLARASVIRKMAFIYGAELKKGAYVRCVYKVGPNYTDAQRCGRIIDLLIKVGFETYSPSAHKQDPYGAFLVRFESGEIQEHYPEHLVVISAPRLVLVSSCA